MRYNLTLNSTDRTIIRKAWMNITPCVECSVIGGQGIKSALDYREVGLYIIPGDSRHASKSPVIKKRIQYPDLDRHLNCAYLCGMIYFTSMRTELIENICFTEVEYNIKTEGEDCASFDGFIDAVLMFVNESGGSLEDAVDMANEAFLGL